MKSRAVLEDHPIHPMLVSLPIGLWIGSLVSDIAGAVSGSRKLNEAGHKMMIGGILGAAAAAVPGVIDYLTVVPPDSEAEDTARLHAISNTAVLSLFSFNAIYRARGGSVGVSIALSSIGCAGLGYAGWLGGNLVYRNQIGIDHLGADGVEHLQLPGIEAIEGEFTSVCGTGDLKVGQLALLVFNGQRLAVCRPAEDRFAAFSDRCTHAGGPLSDGTLIGDTVMCPWHGSEFDVCTGAAACGPACEPITIFETRVTGDRVQVRAPKEAAREPLRAGSAA